ncbi:MAG: amidohydrolase family protein [Planctomycetaceae bacterium]|nr:amidohydrolase family protein [Planctomycetaceae bacterium]
MSIPEQIDRWHQDWIAAEGQERSLSVRWLWNPSAEPLQFVTVREFDGRITDIRENSGSDADRFLPVILVPPLINAHTHLEFSELTSPVEPAKPFAEWIRSVIRFRIQRGHDGSDCLSAGLDECFDHGVAAVADIATSDHMPHRAGVECLRFREAIGLTPERIQQQSSTAESFLRAHAATGRTGLSPHAPYTVHPELLDQLMRMAVQFDVPVAMHLAETREELELLHKGTGELAEFLQGMNLFETGTFPGGRSIREMLEQLARAPKALAVHGNYFVEDDLQYLTRHPGISTVYCPRTHHWFGHTEHPFRRMKELGLNVVLGTDSRASNPDLSVWKELQHVASQFSTLSATSLISMITTDSANALGQSGLSEPLAIGSRLRGTLISAPRMLPFRRLICAEPTKPVLVIR